VRLILLSGLSGAGKTTARFALEDAGYLVVENLPPPLWEELIPTLKARGVKEAAVLFDARTAAWRAAFEPGVARLRALGFGPFIFLEARPEVLLARYNLTRRSHPLGAGRLLDELGRERALLAPLRAMADFVLDTSDLSPRELKARLLALLGARPEFVLRLVSFGYKRGVPQDADLVLDARGFPNPYYEEALRPRSGLDPEVAAYVFAPEHEDRYAAMRALVGLSAEAARAEGRKGYTAAIGCTGGFHRSVAIVERLAEDLSTRFRTEATHRDLKAH